MKEKKVRVKIVHERKKNSETSCSIIAKLCNPYKSTICKT